MEGVTFHGFQPHPLGGPEGGGENSPVCTLNITPICPTTSASSTPDLVPLATSTPIITTNVVPSTLGSKFRVTRKGRSSSTPKSSKRKDGEPTMILTNLDDLALDNLFTYLSDQDLRAFHQVCSSWKEALEKRPSVNGRRLELVRKIRENKENMRNSVEEVKENEVSRRAGLKLEDLLLVDCQNVLQTTSSFNSSMGTEADHAALSTPPVPVSSLDLLESEDDSNLFYCRFHVISSESFETSSDENNNFSISMEYTKKVTEVKGKGRGKSNNNNKPASSTKVKLRRLARL